MTSASDAFSKQEPTNRKTVKHCKHCNKKLSMYNDNDYCFSHIYVGFKKDQVKLFLADLKKGRENAKKYKKNNNKQDS